MKATVLGSGTSTGVPVLTCNCAVCTSTDPHDKRLRASILLQADGAILIDTSPDLRMQLLRVGAPKLEAVLYTHFHYDHLDGLPDLRPFTFDSKKELHCYANPQTHEYILTRYPYIRERAHYSNVPHLDLQVLPGNEEEGYSAFRLAGMEIQPVRLLHVPQAGILSTGYVIDHRFGYLTDFKEIHPDDEKYLYGLDVLYLGAPLDRPHISHIHHGEALELFAKFRPRRAVIGHLAHQYHHEELARRWQGRAEPAYDGMEFVLE